MKSAQSATDGVSADLATQSSFDLSSYVAASSAPHREVDSRAISPGTVAFCAAGALAAVPLTSAHGGLATWVGSAVTFNAAGDGDVELTAQAANMHFMTSMWDIQKRLGMISMGARVGNSAYRSTVNKTVGDGTGMINPALGVVSVTRSLGFRYGFQSGADNFIPVKFQEAGINGGSTVYGWAQVTANNTAGVAPKYLEVVYSDSGNGVNMNGGVFTEVGGGPAPVPEPSTLALLATGAAGALALRKRRREGKRKE